MKFKGFGDWIEIFRGGKQVDSEGREHDGDALIDKALAKFRPSEHEPPIVIGHPADNAPAYGWVESLGSTVKDGVKVLLAKTRQVVPEFAAAVEQGLFKKRSAAFYPDGSLRHVGFLGAVPPAVKGLADIGFKDKGTSFEFEEGGVSDRSDGSDGEKTKNQGGRKMTFKEFMEIFKFWKQAEEDGDTELFGGRDGKQFSEADLEKAKKEAAEMAAREAKAQAEAEFAEKSKAAAKEQSRKDLSAWVEERVKAGKILPAWRDAGLVVFMESLDAERTIQFSEGETGKKPALKWMQDFLESFEKIPIFAEFATKSLAGAQQTDLQQQVETGKRIAAKVTPMKA